MSDYQVSNEVQANLDEIERRYKELMWGRFLTTIALILSLGGIGVLLWYIWRLG